MAPTAAGSPSRLEYALRARDLEVEMFWTRSNFFLALNSGVAVGFFALENRSLALPLAILGLLSSAFWLMANLGGKFWQTRWEAKLAAVEFEECSGWNLYSESPSGIREAVHNHLKLSGKGPLRRLVNRAILLKPSVSMAAVYLSFCFCPLWLFLIVWEQL